MNHREIAAAFANGRVASGHNLCTEHVQHGPTRVTVLVSYVTPVAFRSENGMAYFDERKYSVTTSKQVSYAKQALPKDLICILPHDEFRRQCRNLNIYLGGAR